MGRRAAWSPWGRRLGAAFVAVGAALALSACSYVGTCIRQMEPTDPFFELVRAAVCGAPTTLINPIVPQFRILVLAPGTSPGPSDQDVTVVSSGSTVTLDASPSYIAAPDGQYDRIDSFEWDLNGNGQPVILPKQNPWDPSGQLAQVQFTATSPEQVTITLVVRDGLGLHETVSRVLTVEPPVSQPAGPDIPPIAMFSVTPNPVAPGHVVSFDATATSDQHGRVTDYKWDFGDGSPAVDSGAVANVAHTYRCTGRLTVTLTATNDGGQTGQARVALLVTPQSGSPPCPGTGPAASFTSSPNPASGEAAVTFDASASSDADAPILDYFWEFGDGTDGDSAGPTITHSYFCTGTLTVRLTITDGNMMIDQTTRTQTISPTQGFPDCSPGQPAHAAGGSRRPGPAPLFTARLGGTRIRAHGVLSRTASRTTLRRLVVGGHLHGSITGGSGLVRFSDARFVAALTLVEDSARHAITIEGVALATFGRSRRSRLCLDVRALRRGRHLPIGSFRVLGDSGAAARLSGAGRFAFVLGPAGGRLTGPLHVARSPRSGSGGPVLPAPCRSLQGTTP